MKNAKTYDFKILLRKAEITPTGFSVLMLDPSQLIHQECIETTLQGALNRRAELSQQNDIGHVASLAMKYRDDRKPPGFNKVEPLVRKSSAHE